MGCVSSKQERSNVALSNEYLSARLDRYVSARISRDKNDKRNGGGYVPREKIKEGNEKENVERRKNSFGILSNSRSSKKGGDGDERKIGFSFRFGRQTEGEHVAAGWPAWLTSVAGGAVEGWLPLKSERFQRLEKIGQGTYSSVYRARDLETGKMVAIKKIRFDNFQRESVRFMAREISILRKLDHHQNVMKLEGIITSRLSVNIYLVFEYMEHDLAGLLSCPDIRFSESQIKCYMMQLLSGLEHCHSRGIMHRDIKTSNILVNNEGILKIADFGLANFVKVKPQFLTNRVVTLWYRPPELLLGSTNYNCTVDLWSVGCVFAELLTGRALLKGRTEVEQLHKIFKLCGSPPDEYWKRSKLPLAKMFKPKQPYKSELHERFKELPEAAVNAIKTFLSVDPTKRGRASDALVFEYFNTKPYPCNPSSMPKYPPNKEIDAKFREEARRKRLSGSSLAYEASRNSRRVRNESCDFSKLAPIEVVGGNVSGRSTRYGTHKRRATTTKIPLDTSSVASQLTSLSQNHSIVSGPARMPSDHNALAGLHDSSSSRLHGRVISKSHKLDMVSEDWQANDDSYHPSDIYKSQEEPESRDYVDQQGRIRQVPLLIRKIESRQDTGSNQVVHRSRFYGHKA